MKSYLFKINKNYFLIFCLIFLFSINRLFFSSNFIELIFSYPAYPLLALQSKIIDRVNKYIEKNITINELKTELENLRKENLNLLEENIKIKSSLNFLEKSADLIIYKQNFEQRNLILSKIIFKQFNRNAHFGYVDKGSNENVKKDMIAVFKNSIVGRVCEVYPKFSKVIFITDKTCKIAAFCSRTNAIGIYEGLNDLQNASLNYVNHLETVEENDLIISSGEGLIFPHGFAIGKIMQFSNDGLQYKIQINPIIDLKTLDYCYLISAY